MGIWMIHYRKGFAWQDDPSHEFNWHPFLMTIGLVFLYGNGIKHFYKYYHTRIKPSAKYCTDYLNNLLFRYTDLYFYYF